MTTTTDTTVPDIIAIRRELERLGVPMGGWWAETCMDETGEPAYGLAVALEALADSDATFMHFEWSAEYGWTIEDGGDPPVITEGVLVLDVPDPFDVSAVAEHLRKVVAGEIDEFRRVSTR